VKVSFAPEAEEDLAALLEYLIERNPAAALELERRIFSTMGRLVERAFEGFEQTLSNGEVVRSWAVTPVRIYYQRGPEGLRIVRIYHQARRPILR
jgi:plasmid stabilization system protein ParE